MGILPDILRWFHDVHNTEAPLLPRFCELEETDDWLLGVTKLLELASTAIRCHRVVFLVDRPWEKHGTTINTWAPGMRFADTWAKDGKRGGYLSI